MKNKILTLTLLVAMAFPAMALDSVDEIVIDDDPYIGITVDFSEYAPMVSLSNITKDLSPSPYVRKNNNLITSLEHSKTATKDLFKRDKKVLKFIPKNSKFIVKKILKTAVYKNNTPDEYTTYVLADDTGREYTMADFELKSISRVTLNNYELGLIEEFNRQGNYARVAIYFKKPPLYKDKKPPYTQKELNSVFDYFMAQIKDYKKDRVLFSQRNFRLSMTIPVTTLAYLISEQERLYIEDIEVVSIPKKIEDEQAYNFAKTKQEPEPGYWYGN